MQRATSYAWELEQLVGALDWGHILRYFGITRYRLRGTGSILAYCIRHPEKSPSMFLSRNATTGSHYHHCFGCGVGGWRYHVILTLNAMRQRVALKRYVDGAQCQAYDAVYWDFFEHHKDGMFVWNKSDDEFQRARAQLIELVADIRSADPPPHIQLEEPYRSRSTAARKRRNLRKKLRRKGRAS